MQKNLRLDLNYHPSKHNFIFKGLSIDKISTKNDVPQKYLTNGTVFTIRTMGIESFQNCRIILWTPGDGMLLSVLAAALIKIASSYWNVGQLWRNAKNWQYKIKVLVLLRKSRKFKIIHWQMKKMLIKRCCFSVLTYCKRKPS